MRVRQLAFAGILLALGTIAVQGQQQFQVFVRIVDGSGMPVATLEPADVRIQENGNEGKVIKVEPVNWPLKVQVLLDNGIGLGNDNITHLRSGLRGLLEALPEGSEVTIVTTAPQPRLVVRPTTDRAAQLKAEGLLSPDGGAGRFTESLNEAMQRIEKDKTDYFPVIISVGTTSGDTNNLENTYKQLMKRIEARPPTVHVVMFSKGAASAAGGGAVQTEVGLNVTKFTGGRYEAIAAATRLATLMPEIGAQVSKAYGNQKNQFRITVARPAGASGDLGKISLGTRSGLSATALSMDGRIP
jgi:hypothetical protein